MAYEYLSIERRGSVYIITLQKPPENRLNIESCQELIRAYHTIQNELGPDSEGAVIMRGHDTKYFTTVCIGRFLIMIATSNFVPITQGLDLHEREGNLFSSSDGFYPVSC